MKALFRIFDYLGSLGPSLVFGIVPENTILSGAIMDVGGSEGLLAFVCDVLLGNNKKNEYWTNGYTAEVVKQNGRKMTKIFFRLSDEYEPYYIEPEEFKKILEVWIAEKEKFDDNPEAYQKELDKRGGEKMIEV